MDWADWLSIVRTDAGRWLEGAPPPVLQNVRRAASVAGGARRQTLRMGQLLASDGLVARRYEGALGGAHGANALPFSLLYIGREPYAREFARYFDAGPERASDVFQGSLASFVLHKATVARDAAEADMTVCEAFPGGLVREDDFEHHPMLDAQLRVAPSIELQIRRVRSRAERRLMRDLLRRGAFRWWVDPGLEALVRFRSTLYAPYVRARFGAWGAVDESKELDHRYAKRGRILFVAPRDRAAEPVCGALLFHGPGGALSYQYNGFAAEAAEDPARMAEATASLELAVMEYAIARRFDSIAFGFTRALLDDGLFTHKRRLGCSFAPLAGSPAFRLHVRAGRRAAVFARLPVLARAPEWTALLGLDEATAGTKKRAWRGVLKNYRIPGLDRAIVWTESKEGGPAGRALRETLNEVLDLPAGVEFRTDAGWAP